MVLRYPRPKLVLSLTPLIDVVFILLIFFMLASQFVDWRQITLTPQAQFSGVSRDEQSTSLRLLDDGSFRVNGQNVEELAAAILQLKTNGEDRTIFVVPDSAVDIQRVIDVVEDLNGAGLSKVQLSAPQERASS